jgi:histidinol-phosphate aminotransferase
MNHAIDRRSWLKQTGLALAGVGLSSFNSPYRLKNPADAILLSSNENAYGPSPAARKAILDNYLGSNRYPDDAIVLLQKAVAVHCKVAKENILLGAGSSEIIGLACLHAAKKGGHVICADPSYREWNGQAAAFGLSFRRNHLPKSETTAGQLYGPVIADTRMIYICNPNNPTGTVMDVKAIEQFAINASKKAIVFIDEAYTEYAPVPSLAPLAITNRNIIVARTFSKIYGLAGARIGYAISHPETIITVSKYQPWPAANLSAASTAAAIASLGDHDFVTDCLEKNRQAKEMCYACFREINLEYIPSSANFILFNIDMIAGRFAEVMTQKNIQVKYRDAYGGKWCRVSMGTIEEMQAFTTACKQV